MKLLSLIIPVYNTEQYLKHCLESCIAQDLNINEYEIIIINDGSNDNSEAEIKRFMSEYPNIRYFYQENAGVSAARNKGIECAEGKYIAFVDSDDRIEHNTLKRIIDKAEQFQSELIVLNSISTNCSGQSIEVYPFPREYSEQVLSGIELFKLNYLRGSACGVLFLKNFLIRNKLFFPPGVSNGEDSLFMAFSFVNAKSITHIDINFYWITVREGSASRAWNYGKVKNMLRGLSFIRYYITTKKLSLQQLAILNIKAYGIISNSMFYFFKTWQLSKYFELKSIIKNSGLYPIQTYGYPHFRNKIRLLNFSIDLFCVPFLLRQLFIYLQNFISKQAK